ncbi:MAG: hypothetical protein UR30_C0005G0013 [Candidatus Peregrinibacteria bacterium GW2011_GWC2_33_13]|nr:MAG: hypothetical protein UR30_C0005G0013 [Candidatus Peregrinibacteria bacterium GW2011_GWC2_33_13]
MEKNKYLSLAIKVLKEELQPLTSNEIWEKAVTKSYDKELGTTGRTPWASLGAQLYGSQKSSKYFEKVGSRPTKFILKENISKIDKEKIQTAITSQEEEKKVSYKEKDLHQLMAYYASVYMNVYSKTIEHTKSKKSKMAEWAHPDMVGCFFPFELWQKETSELSSELGSLPVKLYSFELKIQLTFSNIREYFFQAVSNSSWSNEGYLVASEIQQDPEFLMELKRLSSSYGIGIIKLDVEDPDNCEILFPAREKNELDWETINKIIDLNPDFQEFIELITSNIKLKNRKIIKDGFDKIKDIDDLIITK